MCICGAVALGDGLCNIGLVVRNGQSGVGAVDGKTCVIHLTGNGIVNFHSLTILVNVKVEFASGVQDIALVIICGITCFLQIVAAFGKVFQRDFALIIRDNVSFYRSIVITCVILLVQGKFDACQQCCCTSLFALLDKFYRAFGNAVFGVDSHIIQPFFLVLVISARSPVANAGHRNRNQERLYGHGNSLRGFGFNYKVHTDRQFGEGSLAVFICKYF